MKQVSSLSALERSAVETSGCASKSQVTRPHPSAQNPRPRLESSSERVCVCSCHSGALLQGPDGGDTLLNKETRRMADSVPQVREFRVLRSLARFCVLSFSLTAAAFAF